MNAEKVIAAESTIALAGAAAGDLIGQGTERTLPRPRQILSVFLFYGVLSVVAGFGQGPARVAAAAGGVLALTALVLGAAGRNLEELFARAAVLASAPTGGDSAPVGPVGPTGRPTRTRPSVPAGDRKSVV